MTFKISNMNVEFSIVAKDFFDKNTDAVKVFITKDLKPFEDRKASLANALLLSKGNPVVYEIDKENTLGDVMNKIPPPVVPPTDSDVEPIAESEPLVEVAEKVEDIQLSASQDNSSSKKNK